jgi:hypothetical protein
VTLDAKPTICSLSQGPFTLQRERGESAVILSDPRGEG